MKRGYWLTDHLRVFVDEHYCSTADIFRIMRDGNTIRLIIRFRIGVDHFEPGIRKIEIKLADHGRPDDYVPEQIVLCLNNPVDRRAWINPSWINHRGEVLMGYIEYWTDDWVYGSVEYDGLDGLTIFKKS